VSADFEPPWVDDGVAEVSFDCPGEDGSPAVVSAAVHRPRQKASGEPFACGIEVCGLRSAGTLAPDEVAKFNVYGENSWQALSLAIQLVNSQLVHASQRGVVFQWDGEVLDVADLFPWNTASLAKARKSKSP